MRPFVPEHCIPDVTVRSNEHLPDPDVKVSHNEWYATSWEIDFGSQIDEITTTDNTNDTEQTTTHELAQTTEGYTMSKVTGKQNISTDTATPSSPGFSNITTDVGDNTYIRRPPPIESPPIPPKSPPTVVGNIPRKTAKYNLRPNLKPKADPDFRRLDAMTTTH